MPTPQTAEGRTVQTVVSPEGVVTVTITTVAPTEPAQEPKAPLAEPKVPSEPKAPKATKSPRRSTKSTRKSSTKSTKKTTKSSKDEFSELSGAEFRSTIQRMVDEGKFYQAISACRDRGWDPSKTDGRLRPKADKPTKSASKSTKSTKKAASKKPSAPKPKASAKAERPIDQEPKAPAKSQKLTASQERDLALRAKLADTFTTFGVEVDEVLTDFIAKPHRKHVVVSDNDMLLDTWGQLGELEESPILGDGVDDEVVRLVLKANDYVMNLASKAGLA